MARGEMRDAVGFHLHGARLGEPEIVVLGPHGLEGGGKVPGGPIVGHLLVRPVGFRDGVRVGVGEIVLDAAGGVEQLASDFETAKDDGSGPAFEDRLGGGRMGRRVRVGLSA